MRTDFYRLCQYLFSIGITQSTSIQENELTADNHLWMCDKEIWSFQIMPILDSNIWLQTFSYCYLLLPQIINWYGIIIWICHTVDLNLSTYWAVLSCPVHPIQSTEWWVRTFKNTINILMFMFAFLDFLFCRLFNFPVSVRLKIIIFVFFVHHIYFVFISLGWNALCIKHKAFINCSPILYIKIINLSSTFF